MVSIKLPCRIRQPVFALGADLKCRPALAHDDDVTIFDEIGDLADPDHQEKLEELLAQQSPRLILCDRHPGYFSTELAYRIAKERGKTIRDFQHHRAHVASVCIENGLFEETVVGLAFDGTGYGDDGSVWGGEFFIGSVARGFERKAHFATLPIPGGDAAVRQPWRIALALLFERGVDQSIIQDWITKRNIPVQDFALFRKAVSSGVGVGRSSALGRWFDAASALLGICATAGFEAQPAIEMQKLAQEHYSEIPERDWPFYITESDPIIIDFPDLGRIAGSPEKEIPKLALAFHYAVANATAEVADRLATAARVNRVIASGGCFLNALFNRMLSERLHSRGLQYIKPANLPPGDQAIALGQIGLVLSDLKL